MKLFSLLLGLSLVSHSAMGVLALDDEGAIRHFLWKENKKILYRKCSVPSLTEASLEKFKEVVLPVCEADPHKSSFESPEGRFYKSAMALNKVPTKTLVGDSADSILQSLAGARELAHRNQGDMGPSSNFENMLDIYHDLFEPLEPGSYRHVLSKDSTYKQMLFLAISALSPIFSNGSVQLMTVAGVQMDKVFEACPRGWGALSAHTAISLLRENGKALTEWYASVPGGSQYPYALTWAEYFTSKATRDYQTGYTKVKGPWMVLLNDASLQWLNSQDDSVIPALGLNAQEVQPLPGVNKLFFNPSAKYVYTALCLRRQLPGSNEVVRLPSNGNMSLEQIAARYQISEKELYSRMIQDPETEKVFGAFYVLDRNIDSEEFRVKYQTTVENRLGVYLPDWKALEDVAIENEKWQEEQKRIAAQQAREAQIAAQQAEQRRKQQEYQAKVEEQRRINSQPKYARYSKDTNRTYTDSRGNPIDKYEFDRLQNKYNESTYGRRYYDASGNAVSYEDFVALNRAPERQQQQQQIQLYTVPVQQQQLYILVPQIQVQPAYSGYIILR